jgi:hypothetical protein
MRDSRNVHGCWTSLQVEAKMMNTTRRISLVAFLAIIPMAVMTGCNNSTPGEANPAATPPSSTASSVSPSAPNSDTALPPPAESSTTPPAATEPGTDAPSSQEPTFQEPSSHEQEPSSHEPSSHEPSSHESSSQQPAPTGPTVLPTDLSGEVYGFIRGVDVAQSQLTLDKVDWFRGADAEQACAVDNVPDGRRLDGWCSVYYYRNVNPKLRVVSVSPDAAITTLEGTTPVSEDLQALADRVGSLAGEYHPYRITVTDGAIVELTQIYQP